jgi:hypothetical protein
MTVLWLLFSALALSLGPQEPVPDPRSEGDPGRPVLRRGGPSKKHEPVPSSPSVPAKSSKTEAETPEPPAAAPGGAPAAAPAAVRPGPSLIERAREAAMEFDAGLPNFICDELVMRYDSEKRIPDWRYRDRIEVELLYVDGKEDYRNVRRNGKALKKGSPEDSGTWSTGEFGTALVDILSPATNAKFRRRGGSTSAGMAAEVYDFSVEQPNSHWQIRFGRSVKPAYSGALWIDPKTARVLRIEMGTRKLPADYEIDTVESVVDYAWVTISGSKFLLPVKSENLSCARGTFNCTKNEIEFRNYRRFTAESQVMQVESEISFEEDPPKADPKKKKR